jgi:hypothetical protein
MTLVEPEPIPEPELPEDWLRLEVERNEPLEDYDIIDEHSSYGEIRVTKEMKPGGRKLVIATMHGDKGEELRREQWWERVKKK